MFFNETNGALEWENDCQIDYLSATQNFINNFSSFITLLLSKIMYMNNRDV